MARAKSAQATEGSNGPAASAARSTKCSIRW